MPTGRSRRPRRCTRRSSAPRPRGRSSSRAAPGRSTPGRSPSPTGSIADAAAAGIHVIMTVDNTPCWASSAPAPLLHELQPRAAERRQRLAARRPRRRTRRSSPTSPRATARALAAIEVWNEPDQANEDYFAGPRQSRTLRGGAARGLSRDQGSEPRGGGARRIDRGPQRSSSCGRSMRRGSRASTTASSVHFYTLTLAAVRSIHEVQLANGDATPLWLDEFGWTSCWPRPIEQEQGCVTEQTQATNLANTVRSLARAPYVAAAVDYKLQDSTSESFGLTSTSGARKPSFAALASAFSSPFGPAQPRRAQPAPEGLTRDRQRLGAGRRLHAPGSVPRAHAALLRVVDARPLQPLLDRAAVGARHEGPAA